MRPPLGLLVLAGLALGSSACATITYDAVTVEQLVAMNRVLPPGSYEPVGELVVERRPIFLIADLLTVRDVELEEVVRRELARTGGNAVVNLRIVERDNLIDVLISLAQSLPGVPPLVGTRTVTILGDIVRVREGALLAEELRGLRERCRTLEPTDDQPRPVYLCLPAE